jgi:SAM-dependent methyltransferase
VNSLDSIHARERAFHDALAKELDPESLYLRDPDGFGEALLATLGPLDGVQVLELGCGAGDLTAQLVDRGANVTALDLSEGLIDLASARIQAFRPEARVRWVVAAVEATGLEDESVDVVVGKWILHHVDVRRAVAEIRRVLRRGGRAAFFENQARNSLLALARRHAIGRFGTSRLGTEDEHPLTQRDFEDLRSAFSTLELRYPNFHCFELLSSRVLRYRLHHGLRALDGWLWRSVPLVRPYSWHVLITMTKQPSQ